MTAPRDLDRELQAFLLDGPTELPDPSFDAVRDRVEGTRQRVVIGPWRVPDMNKLVPLGAGIAAVAVAVFVGGQLIGSPAPGGVAGVPSVQPSAPPSPTPTLAPTATPVPTPAHVPDGRDMLPGTYFARPLPAPDEALTLTFTVPTGWHGFGDATIFADSGAFQFIDITSLNSDPCRWQGSNGDINAGTTVDDLVVALSAHAYKASDPIDVSIGGYTGKRVDVVYPAELFEGQTSDAPTCDEGVVRLWNTSAHGESAIYGQGPDERWQTNILDVDGTRLVVVVQDFPGTFVADRAEVDAILDSLVIEP